jgi:hypothetical protein
MRKTKLSFDLFAQQHGNDGLFARFYRHPGSAILLQKQVSKASIAKIVGISLPPFTALSRQGGYDTLKGYFYTNLGGTLKWRLVTQLLGLPQRRKSWTLIPFKPMGKG